MGAEALPHDFRTGHCSKVSEASEAQLGTRHPCARPQNRTGVSIARGLLGAGCCSETGWARSPAFCQPPGGDAGRETTLLPRARKRGACPHLKPGSWEARGWVQEREHPGGSAAMGTGEAWWARGTAAKGTAEPALLSPLLGGSQCSQQTQQAKCCWVFNGKKNPRCRSADPASLPYPSRSPEEGKIPLRSSAERNLASALMDWGPGDPKAAASLAVEVLEQEQRPTTQPAAPQGLCFSSQSLFLLAVVRSLSQPLQGGLEELPSACWEDPSLVQLREPAGHEGAAKPRAVAPRGHGAGRRKVCRSPSSWGSEQINLRFQVTRKKTTISLTFWCQQQLKNN